jgi:hypothetical protein
MAAHSADIQISHDPVPFPFFGGTSNPQGPSYLQVNTVGDNPGYLNNMSGGLNGGATGNVAMPSLVVGETELVGIAIHVADSSGSSHSLSTNNDPALLSIVNDLNNSPFEVNSGQMAYSYTNAPEQYADQIAALSAGEQANSGQPFDILVVETYPNFPSFLSLQWGFDFSDEIGNLDGISTLSITDVGGIVPEPAEASLAFLAGLALVRFRQRT